MCKMFQLNMNDMVTSFLDTAQEYFSRLRALETEYNANITTVALSYLSSIEESEKSTFVNSLLEDGNALKNCLSGSHFTHLQVHTI